MRLAVLLACGVFASSVAHASDAVHLEGGAVPRELKDMGVTDFHLYDFRGVAVFKDRVQFYRFPPEVRLGRKGLLDNGKPASLLDYKPLRIMQFAVPFELVSRGLNLICTHPAKPRLAREGLDDFCGIVGLDGKVVFQYPLEQHNPEDMLQIIGLTEDGQYAEVYLGRFIPSPDDRRFQIVEPREIFSWWYPDRLFRYPGPWAKEPPKDTRTAFESVFRDFGRRAHPLDTTGSSAQ